MEQVKTRRQTQREANQEVTQPDYRKMHGIGPTPRSSAQLAAEKAAKQKMKKDEEKKNEEKLKELAEIESNSMPLKKAFPPKRDPPSAGKKKTNVTTVLTPTAKAGIKKKPTVSATSQTPAMRTPVIAVATKSKPMATSKPAAKSKSTALATPTHVAATRERSPVHPPTDEVPEEVADAEADGKEADEVASEGVAEAGVTMDVDIEDGAECTDSGLAFKVGDADGDQMEAMEVDNNEVRVLTMVSKN